MYKLLVFIIFLLSFQFSFSQVDSIQLMKGDAFDLGEKSSPNFLIGKDSTGYNIRYSEGKYGGGESKIVKFDNNLQPTGEEFSIYSGNIKDVITKKLLKVGDSLLHIYSDNDDRKRRFYYQWLDNKYSFLAEPIEFLEIKKVGGDIDDIYIKISYKGDENLIQTVYELPNSDGDQQVIRIHYYQMDQNNDHFIDYNLQDKNKNLSLYSFHEIEGQKFLAVYKHDLGGLFSSDNGRNYQYDIYILANDTLSLLKGINNEGHHLRQLSTLYNDSTKIITLLGYYADKDMYSVKGSYFSQIDVTTGEINEKKFTPFTVDPQLEILNEKQKRRFVKSVDQYGLPELENYVLRKAYFRNKHYYLFGEKYYYSNYHYQFGNFLITKIAPDGSVTWVKIIRKYNTDPMGKYRISTYFDLWMNEDKLLILYNDNIQNQGVREGKIYSGLRFEEENVLFGLTINSDGEYRRNVFVRPEDMLGYDLIPFLTNLVKQDNGKLEFLLFLTKKGTVKTQKFMKLNVYTE